MILQILITKYHCVHRACSKNGCEVVMGESEFFEPEEARKIADGFKDCDLIVVMVKGFTWFGECINEFTKLGVPVCCWAVPEPQREGVLLFNSMTGLNLLQVWQTQDMRFRL